MASRAKRRILTVLIEVSDRAVELGDGWAAAIAAVAPVRVRRRQAGSTVVSTQKMIPIWTPPPNCICWVRRSGGSSRSM
jgi:hypothetical protein